MDSPWEDVRKKADGQNIHKKVIPIVNNAYQVNIYIINTRIRYYYTHTSIRGIVWVCGAFS